jgi:hypothetical protein
MLRTLAPSLHAVLMNPDPAGGGAGGAGGAGSGEGKPELAKVTLPGGVTIEMPKADAEKFIIARTKENEEKTALAAKAGAAEAEKSAAIERANREAQDKEAIKLAKDGEIEKAKAILTADANKRYGDLSARLRDQETVAAIRRSAPHLDDAAVEDMKSLITSRAAFDAESGKVIILGSDNKPMMKDGQPVDVQTFLPDWLATRSHFRSAAVPAPNGGTGGKQTITGSIRVGELATATKEQIAAVVKGTMKVID